MNPKPKKLKRAVIREELVALTQDYKKAIILSQFIYWSERVRDVDKFLIEEKKRMESHGMLEAEFPIELQNGWIYKTAEEMSEETMMGIAPNNMRKHIKYLEENGWLDSRTNPQYKWDKTLQYRVNLVKIQKDLKELGYALDGYALLQEEETENTKRTLEPSKTYSRENVSSSYNTQNVQAIPEITTETTEIMDGWKGETSSSQETQRTFEHDSHSTKSSLSFTQEEEIQGKTKEQYEWGLFRDLCYSYGLDKSSTFELWKILIFQYADAPVNVAIKAIRELMQDKVRLPQNGKPWTEQEYRNLSGLFHHRMRRWKAFNAALEDIDQT